MNIKTDNKIHGVITGTVVENYNKDYPGKVKVTYSFGEKGKNKSGWIPVSMPYVSSEAGVFFFPEVGSEVLISFILGNINRPIVTGSIYNTSVKMPSTIDYEKNTVKLIQTKAGHKIIFNEEADKETIEITSKKGLTIKYSDADEKITITDSGAKSSITADFKSGGITIDAEKKLVLSVGGTAALTVESNKATLTSGTLEVKGTQSLKLEGQTTSVSGSSVEIAAQGSMKVSSSGILEAKGTMVKLN
ncbi:MAG: phage baseplate assembly protein V [Clostridia bacterium]